MVVMVVVALYHCSVCYTGRTSKKIAGLKILELQCLQIVLRLVLKSATSNLPATALIRRA